MKFENLDVWKRSATLAIAIFQHFKSSREYCLKDQIKRSSLSISSNIAEGYERMSSKDCVRFLYYAKGSCGVLRSQLYLSLQVGEVSTEQANKWIIETQELSMMLAGLIRAINNANQR